MIVLEYPKCGTCRKALKWLNDNNITFEDRKIHEEKPTEEELRKWHAESGLPLNKMFNTSGKLYRELNLKEKLKTMTDDEKYALLASDGMLVKRPVVVKDSTVLIGFKEDDWKEKLL